MDSQIPEDVAKYIYRCNTLNIPVYFGILCSNLTHTRSEISIALDFLFDICMIDAKWETIEGKWCRCYHTSHAYDEYFKSVSV
ncbi:MAG: hypothetical protein PHN69_07435 [Candidatus Pacebacteria bacterium]|nr:hypothetical protein [Candidatus Paceibacterota bacterium]